MELCSRKAAENVIAVAVAGAVAVEGVVEGAVAVEGVVEGAVEVEGVVEGAVAVAVERVVAVENAVAVESAVEKLESPRGGLPWRVLIKILLAISP